jgi:hypothetical protein
MDPLFCQNFNFLRDGCVLYYKIINRFFVPETGNLNGLFRRPFRARGVRDRKKPSLFFLNMGVPGVILAAVRQQEGAE